MNDNIYTQGEILNNIYQENDKEIKIEISDISTTKALKVEMDINSPVYSISTDISNRTSSNTMFGEGILAGINWEFNSHFAYQGDTRKLQQTVVNGGSVALDNSKLRLSSGTNTNGYANASSKRSLRYRPGQEGITGFTFMTPTRVVGNDRFIGLIDDDNGFAVGVRDLEFGIFHRRGGVLSFIPQSDFNYDKLDGTGESGFTINTEKLNIIRITYAYFGIAPPTFEIYTFNKGFVPFHKMDFINNSTVPHITLPYLKFGAYNVNTTNTTNVTISSGSLAVGIIGNNDRDVSTRNFMYASQSFTISTGTISGIPNLQRLVVFHNKPTYGITPVTNKIESLVNLISASVFSANKAVTLKRFKLNTIPTGTWTDQSINSIMRYSTDATIDLTGAELTLSIELGTSDKFFETTKIAELDLRSLPNDYLAYVIETQSSTGEFKLSSGWKELF